MKHFFIILSAILLLSAPALAWSDSKDNQEYNIQSSDSGELQQTTKETNLNGVKKELNKEKGEYNLAESRTACKAWCKHEYNSCKDICFSIESDNTLDICIDGCMRDYEWCIEDCYGE